MILKTKLALVAVAATGALALSACGNSAADFLYSSASMKGSGNVNLNTFDPGLTWVEVVPPGSPRTIPTGSTGTGKLNLTATYNGGNWNVSGSWSDGDVKFNVKGWAFECLHPWISDGCALEQIPVTAVGAKGTAPGTITVNGGMCLSAITHYVSTNKARPGTGWAHFTLCDGGVPWSSRVGGQAAAANGGIDWSGPDYVQVFIPDSQEGDLNPFANYLSGGGFSSGGTTNIVTFLSNSPSYSPTPSWSSPSPSADS